MKLKIDHGSLHVRGSDGPDGLYIFVGPDGTAFVTPIAATTVNGVAGMQQFQYVTTDAFLDLGDGNDALTLGGTFPRGVRATLGDGDDEFAAQRTVERSHDARLGDGRDRIDVHDTDVIGNVRLDAGDAWQAVGLTSDQIGGSLVVELGAQPLANDRCTIQDVEVGRRALIRTRGDPPQITLLDSRLRGKTRIVQRGGTAAWELSGCEFDDDLAIRASGDIDVETTVAARHRGYSFVGAGKPTASWLSVAGVSGAVTMRSSADLAKSSLHQCSITGRTRIDLHRAAESHGWSGYPSFTGAARIEFGRGNDVLDMHHAKAAAPAS